MNLRGGIVLLAFLLLIPTTHACLSSSQIFLVGNIAEAANVSVDDTLVLFEHLCNRSYSKGEVDTLIIGSEDAVEDYMDNYTAYFEEQTNIADALIVLGEVMNVSNTVDMIEVTLMTRMAEIEERIDAKVDDLMDEYDSENFVDQDDYDRLDDRVTGMVSAQPEPIATEWIVIGVVILIAGGIWAYNKWQKDTGRKRLIDTAPKIHHKPGTTISGHNKPGYAEVEVDDEGKLVHKDREMQALKKEADRKAIEEAKEQIKADVDSVKEQLKGGKK